MHDTPRDIHHNQPSTIYQHPPPIDKMGRRNNTGLMRRPGLHKNDPHQYEGAQPMERPARYNKLPLGGLYPQNLAMSTPAWCVVEGCGDSDRAKYPLGRWTTKGKVKTHLQKHHAKDVLEDTYRQTFRVLCQSNIQNVRSRGDGVSFYVVGNETDNIPIPAALGGKYQAFAPVAINQLVQPFQPIQPPQAPFLPFEATPAQSSPAPVNQGVNHLPQSASPIGQPFVGNEYEQIDYEMNLGWFGNDGDELDLGTQANPIDLSHLDSYNQPAPTFDDNGFGLGLANIISSPRAIANNNDLDSEMRQFGYDNRPMSNGCGFELNCSNYAQQAHDLHHSDFGFNQLFSLVHGKGLNLATVQFDLPVQAADNNFDADMYDMSLSQQFVAGLNESDINDLAANLAPNDQFGQQAAGFIDTSSQPGGRNLNDGTKFDQIPLTANYFDFDGTVINESAVLAALSRHAPFDFTAEDIAAVNQGIGGDPEKEAALQAGGRSAGRESFQPGGRENDFEAEMEKGFNILNSIKTVGLCCVEPAPSPADGDLNFGTAGAVASPSFKGILQGAAVAGTDFDVSFGEGSATFLSLIPRRVLRISLCPCFPHPPSRNTVQPLADLISLPYP